MKQIENHIKKILVDEKSFNVNLLQHLPKITSIPIFISTDKAHYIYFQNHLKCVFRYFATIIIKNSTISICIFQYLYKKIVVNVLHDQSTLRYDT